MSTCNLSNFSSIWFKHTSSHWFPHRSPSTIIYQQVHDISSYNIRSSPLWGRSGLQDLQSQSVLNLQQLGPGPGLLWGGGEKELIAQSHELQHWVQHWLILMIHAIGRAYFWHNFLVYFWVGVGEVQWGFELGRHHEKECPWQCWVNIGSMLSMPGLRQPDFMYVYV